MYAQIYICMYVCMYVCYVCMYVCTADPPESIQSMCLRVRFDPPHSTEHTHTHTTAQRYIHMIPSHKLNIFGCMQDMRTALSIEASSGSPSTLSSRAKECLSRCQRMVPALAKIPMPMYTHARDGSLQQQRNDVFVARQTDASDFGEPRRQGAVDAMINKADAARKVHVETFGGNLKSTGGKMTGAGLSNGDILDRQVSSNRAEISDECDMHGRKACVSVRDTCMANGAPSGLKHDDKATFAHESSHKNTSITASQHIHIVENTASASPKEKACSNDAGIHDSEPESEDPEATTQSALLVAENLKTDGNVKFTKGYYGDAIQDYRDALDMLMKPYVACTSQILELQNVCRMNIAASALKKSIGLKREKEAAEVLQMAVSCCNDVLRQDETKYDTYMYVYLCVCLLVCMFTCVSVMFGYLYVCLLMCL
jgi:hypothetical protein